MNPNQEPVQPLENSSPAASRRDWSKLVICLVGVLLVGIGIVIGLSISSIQHEAELIPSAISPSPTILITESSPSTNVSSDTTTWQTYQDKHSRFMFEYPNEYTPLEGNTIDDVFLRHSNGNDSIQITVEQVGEFTCHEAICEHPAISQVSYGMTTWDYLGEIEGYCDMGMCSTPYTAYRTIHNDSRYYVKFYYGDVSEDMLPRFRFIE